MVDDNAISLMKINDSYFNQLLNDVNANSYNPKIMQSEQRYRDMLNDFDLCK